MTRNIPPSVKNPILLHCKQSLSSAFLMFSSVIFQLILQMQQGVCVSKGNSIPNSSLYLPEPVKEKLVKGGYVTFGDLPNTLHHPGWEMIAI